jgi:cytochrome c oxidase subunit 2
MRTRRRFLAGFALAAGSLAAGWRVRLAAQPAPRVIAVVARKFTYDPDVITLKVDEPVLFRLTSDDVVMGFSVPDFGVRATILPGQVTELRLTPTRTGEFTFLCDVFCGSGHENMEGTLRVSA